jgi:hypothetical protein
LAEAILSSGLAAPLISRLSMMELASVPSNSLKPAEPSSLPRPYGLRLLDKTSPEIQTI